MQVHARAPLSPIGRRRVVERVRAKTWSVMAAAEAAGVTERTIYRWLARFRDHGARGLIDRPPIANHQPRKTAGPRGRDLRAASVAYDRRRDRRGLGDAAVDRLGGAVA